ncbi:MAG TPA: hypothetical protein GXX51_05685 [Firmicutes bacterium]|nr:hypothetical protein [Bacillota bacterium]
MKEKPTPGELRNVDVRFISLVDRGANRRKFKIFKSADWPENEDGIKTNADEPDGKSAPEGDKAEEAGTVEVVKEEDQEMKGFFQAVKEFFLKRFGALKALEECRVEEVEKSGRKISAARLAALKEAHSLLGRIIAEAETDGENGEGGTDVTKEEFDKALGDVLKQVEESIKRSIGPIEERVSRLEQAEGELRKTLEESVKKAVESLSQRVETVEKARSISQSILAEGTQDKPKGTFTGVIFGKR